MAQILSKKTVLQLFLLKKMLTKKKNKEKSYRLLQ